MTARVSGKSRGGLRSANRMIAGPAVGVLAMLIATGPPLHAQDSPTQDVAPLSFAEPPIEAMIQKPIGEAAHPLLRWPRFPDYQDDLEGFFLWTSRSPSGLVLGRLALPAGA